MGWNITYHPISVSEINSAYFNQLGSPNHAQSLANKYQLDEMWIEGLQNWFNELSKEEAPKNFNASHGFRIAVIAGLLRKYWYIRGGAFSFPLQENKKFHQYIHDWKTILPAEYSHLDISNTLTHNYMAGTFLSYEGLCQLKKDYNDDPEVKNILDEHFSHGRLPVFWNAVDYAIENKLGLLEASEIIEPNPLDLEATQFATDAENCDPEGLILYVSAAHEQLEVALSLAPGQEDLISTQPKKKSFWKRLFGK